jgi:hypothetical protein
MYQWYKILGLNVNGNSRNWRMEETSRRQRGMEASSEGGQGPEGSSVDGWMRMGVELPLQWRDKELWK